MRTRGLLGRTLVALGCLASVGLAQERAGESEIGFQHFSLTNGSQRAINAFGLTLGYREFVPRLGMVSVSLAPAASDGRFRTGESFAELKRLPLLGQYWTLRGGDFRLEGRLLDVPFGNLFYPQIAGRGGLVEATHGSRTFGFFFGSGTLQAGMRVPIRIQTPQMMGGFHFRQQVGERLFLGLRAMAVSNNLDKLRSAPYLTVVGDPAKSSRTLTLSALYTVTGPLKWYNEAAVSGETRSGLGQHSSSGPLSVTTGPLFETDRFTLRGNYIKQTASYLPLLGYYLGDRRGPFAEVTIRPFARLHVFGSASQYTNNVARDPQMPTYVSRMQSGGLSLVLPARFNFSGQWSSMRMAARRSEANPWESTNTEQFQATLTRAFRRHQLQLGVRELEQTSRTLSQRQRSAEVGENLIFGPVSLGGEVRAQKLVSEYSKVSVFARGNGQIRSKYLSLYAYFETGNDLASQTLLASSALSSTVIGGEAHLPGQWDFHVEAFRSRLTTELNLQNLFALQGRGIAVPAVLTAMNQWSLHFRMTKRMQWGRAMPPNVSQLDTYAAEQVQLRGSVEGFVTTGPDDGNSPVEGIPVALDDQTTVTTGADGKYRFENVDEGMHKVSLAMSVLPADYDPGKNVESTVAVKPGKATRADLDVVAAGYAIPGIVEGPKGVSPETIIVRLQPSGQMTTPDKAGWFTFHNVKAGTYQVELDQKTLPEHGVLTTPTSATVKVGAKAEAGQVRFGFEIRIPPKPVRKIVVPQSAPVVPPPAATQPAAPDGGKAAKASAPEPKPQVLAAPTIAVDPQQLYVRGRALVEAQDFAGAVAALNAVIAAKPDFHLAYNARGYAFLRLKQWNQADRDFSAAIRLRANYGNAYRNRSMARRALGDVSGASADAEKADALR